MAAESGRKVAVGLGKEATRGTAVAATRWVKDLEIDFIQKAKKELNESNLNVLAKNSESEVMEDWAEGKIGGKITDRTIGLILAAAFGAAPTAAVNADASGLVYDQTYAESQLNESLSLTVAIKDALRDERYAMAMLKTLELTLAAGQWAKFSSMWLSKKPTASAGNTVAYVAENEFKAKHATVKFASTVGGLGAATALSLKDLKLTLDRGVDPYFALGSNDPNNIFAKEVDIKGDFTALFDSLTHRDAFLANTYQAMSITLENTDVTIGTAAHPKLVLTFPRVTLSDWGLNQGLGNMVEQTLGLQPLYSQADGYLWSAVLTNLVASY